MKANTIFISNAPDYKQKTFTKVFAYGVNWNECFNKFENERHQYYRAEKAPQTNGVYMTDTIFNNGCGHEWYKQEFFLNGKCLYTQFVLYTVAKGRYVTLGYVELLRENVQKCTTKTQFKSLLKTERFKAEKKEIQRVREEMKERRDALFSAHRKKHLKTNLRKYKHIFK